MLEHITGYDYLKPRLVYDRKKEYKYSGYSFSGPKLCMWAYRIGY